MRILFPLQVFYPSQAGGSANTVYWIAKALARPEFETVIVATDQGIGSNAPINLWTESDAGRAIYVRTRSYLAPFRQTLVLFRPLFESDIVHISSVFYPAAFFSGILARLLRKKLVFSVHGELDEHALRHSRLRKAIVLFIVRRFIADRALFHSTCDAETLDIGRVFGASARAVQITNYMEIPAPEVRSRGDRYLLFIGRINPLKAIENLLRAIAVSSFRGSGFVLKVAGKGNADYETALRKLSQELGLEDLVQFVGHVEGADKQRLLANAYFTVLPSHTENFGVVVTESLSQGTPVIASLGTPWESLEKGGVGFWVDNSPETLADCLERVVGMPEAEYLAMRERARPFVEQRFDIRSNIGQWEDLYREVFAG